MAFSLLHKVENFQKLHQNDFDYLNSDNISFQNKILAMANMLKLKDEEMLERKIIVSDIIRLLKPFYPNGTVRIFGSSMNGFGFRGCDLDLLFLPFPEYCNLDFKDTGKDVVIPKVHQVLKGHYPIEQLSKFEEHCHLKFVQRLMYTAKHYFKKVVFIPAKCPILSIQFVRNNISCDFSASNRLVMHNTEVLWLFGKLDSRVRPLVMVLRYWAKSLGFITKSRLSSYAFTLMVIFFLQNIKPPILPSIRQLTQVAGYSRAIDGWETAINCDYVFRSENDTSIDQLLIQFFDFYWNFDFIQNVVSPYHGRPLHFKELKESHDNRVKMFKVTSFSIQDAFILSRNISRNADMKTSFKLSLLLAKKHLLRQNLTYQSLFNPSFYKKEVDQMSPFKLESLISKNLALEQNFTFQSLFNPSFYQEEMDEMFAATKNSLSEFAFFPLYLNYELYCKLGITSQFAPWYMKVSQTVLDILQYGLLAECEVVDKVIWNEKVHKHPAKRRKLNVNSDVNLELIMSIQCRFHFSTMHHRRSIKETDLKDEEDDMELPDTLRKQFQISKVLIKYETVESPTQWFMCHCYKYSGTQISDIVITFSPFNNQPADSKFLLKSFVQKHINKILEGN